MQGPVPQGGCKTKTSTMATNNSRAPSSSTKKGAKTAQEYCLICDKVIKAEQT